MKWLAKFLPKSPILNTANIDTLVTLPIVSVREQPTLEKKRAASIPENGQSLRVMNSHEVALEDFEKTATFRLSSTEIVTLPEVRSYSPEMAPCQECAELVAGRCMAARDGLINGVMRNYSPVPDIFRRCDQYQPRMAAWSKKGNIDG